MLEIATLAHVAIFVLAATWMFGGQADWVRMPLGWWGTLSLAITLVAMANRQAWRDGWMHPLRWLWPIALINVLVVAAAMNPSFRPMQFEGETLLVNLGARPGWPSSARPQRALEALWLFDAIWLTCFNLTLVIRQRRALRALLLLVVSNALLLALFGIAQKVAKARGLYFDAVPSPQVNFFASFVYHNHWGAFAVLMMAAWLALIWHYGRRSGAREFLHSPAFGGVFAVLVIAAAVPLSNSRSCTLLTLVLLGAAFVHLGARIVEHRRRTRESLAPPLVGALAALGFAAGGIWYLAGESIVQRAEKTQEQVALMRERGTIGDRAILYNDTWRMAKDKLWFGWGMASYPHVFSLYNTRESKVDRLPVNYHDAHSDWLQAFAEHGVIGSALLGLCAIVPLWRRRLRHLLSPWPAYLIGGCGLIVLYAWIEFPFGNLAVVLTWWLCFFSAIQYVRLHERDALRTK